MIRWIVTGVFMLGAANCMNAPRHAGNASEQLAWLGEDFWETAMENSPGWATYLGDYRFNDRLSDLGPVQRAKEEQQDRAFLARLNAIDVRRLSEEEQVTADILRFRIEISLMEYPHRLYQVALDQMEGPQVSFPMLVNFHPRRNVKDYEDLLARFNAFPRYMDQYLDNLREGVREGRVSVRVAAQRVIEQLKEMLARPVEESPLLTKPVEKFPDALPENTRSKIRKMLAHAIEHQVYPAYQKMLDHLEKEYFEKTRDKEVGIWAVTGGREAYQYRIKNHTTLDITAEELHRIGREELASIRNEMTQIARRRGHTGDLRSFVEKLRSDPEQVYRKREDLLNGFREILKKVDRKLPEFFGRLPKIGYEVQPIERYREKDSVAAFYYGPPEDGSRQGIFYANTYKPESRPKYNMTALAVHEAVPGHHLQIVIAMENKDLPQFRRHFGATAFIEGWALYTERLADEMGLYEDDLSRFGMLTYQAWRACRLVVDTGLHAMQWTRQQAIDFMTENLALPENEIVNEVDRYIIWPGQALAYKMGQREILSLRAWAQQELGAKFSLKEYHDEILRHGAVPLPILRTIVQRWVERKKR